MIQTFRFDGFDKAFRVTIQIRTSGRKGYRFDSRQFQNLMKSFWGIKWIPIVDQIAITLEKTLFHVRQNHGHLFHIGLTVQKYIHG